MISYIRMVFKALHLRLLKWLELMRAARAGNREVRAVQREKLEPAIHRVVISEAQHSLLLAEGLVPFEHHPRRVGLKERLVQSYSTSYRCRIVFQVQELHDAGRSAGIRSEPSAAACDFED